MWFCNPIFQNLCYLMHLGQLKPFNNFSIFLSQGWKYHSDDISYYNWIFTCLWSISMFIDIEIVQIRFKQFVYFIEIKMLPVMWKILVFEPPKWSWAITNHCSKIKNPVKAIYVSFVVFTTYIDIFCGENIIGLASCAKTSKCMKISRCFSFLQAWCHDL